jgi:hypothetical protein
MSKLYHRVRAEAQKASEDRWVAGKEGENETRGEIVNSLFSLAHLLLWSIQAEKSSLLQQYAPNEILMSATCRFRDGYKRRDSITRASARLQSPLSAPSQNIPLNEEFSPG